jgi:hypothetical protein
MPFDPVIRDHQDWIGFVQPEGLVVSPHALRAAQAVLSRNVAPQQEILRRHTVVDSKDRRTLKDFPAFSREFLAWEQTDLVSPPDDLSTYLHEYSETLRPTWAVPGTQGESPWLILVDEIPAGTEFDKPAAQTDERRWYASGLPEWPY